MSLVDLDCVGLDVHVWMVTPKKLEGVCAFHFLVVLYLDPRLGEVLEDGEGVLIPESHVLFVELDEVLVLHVCDEHCDADFGRGFLDVVRGPPLCPPLEVGLILPFEELFTIVRCLLLISIA